MNLIHRVKTNRDGASPKSSKTLADVLLMELTSPKRAKVKRSLKMKNSPSSLKLNG